MILFLCLYILPFGYQALPAMILSPAAPVLVGDHLPSRCRLGGGQHTFRWCALSGRTYYAQDIVSAMRASSTEAVRRWLRLYQPSELSIDFRRIRSNTVLGIYCSFRTTGAVKVRNLSGADDARGCLYNFPVPFSTS